MKFLTHLYICNTKNYGLAAEHHVFCGIYSPCLPVLGDVGTFRYILFSTYCPSHHSFLIAFPYTIFLIVLFMSPLKHAK